MLKSIRAVFRSVAPALMVVLATACAQPLPILKEEAKEQKMPDLPMMSPPSTVGSLWQDGNGRAYMFEDLRASRVGDIVVVKIVEDHKGSKSADTTADRDSSYDGSLGGSFLGLNDLASALVDGVALNASSKNEFEGKGSTSREDTLTGTIAARVVEVLPNGDMRIKGRREVTVNSEKQTMIISGIVRRIDLDTTNTVLSSSIADAQIEYSGLGVVDDVQRPGWGVRIIDWILPL
ncbi:flagellar basal body L-ring protein FlgH [Candidatus Nitronereus thalassa]|uniref:Flagellar L-ring protein n=1 Tax=Candidatus Nitronereus thalassa TaxID=3020898 RepID=A0ABU3K621_9BACT|nr:flagellar basal body L-ring protein FlgH [Candidatus Nitronereus thalassa]MDT7041867.1 flagellar basal body L-ring protein FlgH [Candidatus Nitronereus thalassa]